MIFKLFHSTNKVAHHRGWMQGIGSQVAAMLVREVDVWRWCAGAGRAAGS
jgi:hypothetical protein